MNWYEGDFKTKTIAATAGNVATSLSPSTVYKKIKVLSFYITLVCDATVANRKVFTSVQTSGGATLEQHPMGANVAASVTGYEGGTSGNLQSFSGQNPITSIVNIGDCWVTGTDKFVLAINSGVVGDSYSGSIKYVEIPA